MIKQVAISCKFIQSHTNARRACRQGVGVTRVISPRQGLTFPIL